MMKNFFGTDFEDNRIIIGEGDTLSLGTHTLTFVTAPMVHWPEVVVTYDSKDKVLFSADGFGKFGALDADEDWACEARRYYFNIVGKYGPQVNVLLNKASNLEIETICPLHGVILKENISKLINLYTKWPYREVIEAFQENGIDRTFMNIEHPEFENAMDALAKAGLDASKHMIAVTSETSPLAKSADYLAAFFMDDYIGGRYSSTSAVGGAILSMAFGPEVFEMFLEGAAEADAIAKNTDITKNPAMLDALIGVYERNVLGYPSTAVLPYSQALSRFPAHLQQLDMESNGKSVNRFGEPVNYVTGPIIFGEPGTNGQHSFYQLLHQGTDIVPLQFVGFKNSQMGSDVVIQGSTSQQKLCANVAAQIVAFACGKDDTDLNKKFEGGRPSSIIIGEKLTPASLGALLAHFENKVMFQGFAWNINSFDQEGVQLGKVLAKKVLAHDTDGALKVYSDLLNI